MHKTNQHLSRAYISLGVGGGRGQKNKRVKDTESEGIYKARNCLRSIGEGRVIFYSRVVGLAAKENDI